MTTWNGTIAVSADDAQEAATSVTINGSTIVADTSPSYLGFRFLNVTIPNAATITAATMQVYCNTTSKDTAEHKIHCEDVDDAAAFAASSSNISNRPLTTAFTLWSAADMGVGWHTTPDFAAAVQEVVNRAGWASGNDLAVIFVWQTNGALRVQAYDSGSNIATITIDYTTGAATGANPKVGRVRLSTKVGGLLA
jgi:hypothetical protein